ncbi:hypothetical protein M8J77_022255 [Diaphorina citri]|nr:hypothetical protein M8J77_022255 [Diaphorina citri]
MGANAFNLVDVKPNLPLSTSWQPAGDRTRDRRMQTDKFCQQAEVALVIGSSNQVYPAAGWPQEMAAFEIPVAEFNTRINTETRFFKWFFEGKVTQTLPEALGIPDEKCVPFPPSHSHPKVFLSHKDSRSPSHLKDSPTPSHSKKN